MTMSDAELDAAAARLWEAIADQFRKEKSGAISDEITDSIATVGLTVSEAKRRLSGESRDDVWLSLCLKISTEVVDSLLETADLASGQLTATQAATVVDFAALFTSLVIVVAQSDLDLTQGQKST